MVGISCRSSFVVTLRGPNGCIFLFFEVPRGMGWKLAVEGIETRQVQSIHVRQHDFIGCLDISFLPAREHGVGKVWRDVNLRNRILQGGQQERDEPQKHKLCT